MAESDLNLFVPRDLLDVAHMGHDGLKLFRKITVEISINLKNLKC